MKQVLHVQPWRLSSCNDICRSRVRRIFIPGQYIIKDRTQFRHEKNDKNIRNDWREDVQIVAKFEGHRPLRLQMLNKFETMLNR